MSSIADLTKFISELKSRREPSGKNDTIEIGELASKKAQVINPGGPAPSEEQMPPTIDPLTGAPIGTDNPMDTPEASLPGPADSAVDAILDKVKEGLDEAAVGPESLPKEEIIAKLVEKLNEPETQDDLLKQEPEVPGGPEGGVPPESPEEAPVEESPIPEMEAIPPGGEPIPGDAVPEEILPDEITPPEDLGIEEEEEEEPKEDKKDDEGESEDKPEKKEDEESEEKEEPEEDKKDDEDKSEDKEEGKKDDEGKKEDKKDDESEDDELPFAASETLKPAILKSSQTHHAVLFRSKNLPDATWVIYSQDRTPVMKVSAKEAFRNTLDRKPDPNYFPAHFATHGDVFISEDYGDALLESVAISGVEKTCEASYGQVIKEAQIGVSPQTGGPAGAGQERQPSGTVTPAGPLPLESNSEGGSDTNFNPTDNVGTDDVDAVTVSDYILTLLSVEVANGTYSIQEVMASLRETFNDDQAASLFEGALAERADHITGDKSGVSEAQENTQEQAPEVQEQTPATPEGNTSETSNAGANANPEPAGSSDVLPKAAQLAEENAMLRKQNALRAKLSSAVDFVRYEMQTRGTNNKPLVPTVDYLMASGFKQEAAIEREREEVYKVAQKIVQMNAEGWDAWSELIMNQPRIVPSMPSKRASSEPGSQGNSSLPVFMANDNSIPADIIPDDVFDTKLTQLAREHNRQRSR